MSFIKLLLFTPLSWMYALAVSVRNWFYDTGIIEGYKSDIPVISVGNLTVGGTGKTPFTEYLIQFFSSYYEVAVLSRGYRRTTKGFVLADESSDFLQIGDEPFQMKMKFPSVSLAVCEDRKLGIIKLRELCPNVSLIILDDAFQHRKVVPCADVVMMDYNRPIYDDCMLPKGRLRDLPSQLPRADVVITSKCPDNLTDFDMNTVRHCLNLYSYQNLYFTRIVYSGLTPLFPSGNMVNDYGKGTPVIVMTGIASPGLFIQHVESTYNLVDTFLYPDHHQYMVSDMHRLEHRLKRAPKGTIVAITEKDAVKLCKSKKLSNLVRKSLYYVGIRHEFVNSKMEEEFKNVILNYAKKNSKNIIPD